MQSVKRRGYAKEVRELAALRDEGLITEEEFTAKKRILLGLDRAT